MTIGTTHIFYSDPDELHAAGSDFVKVIVKPTQIIVSERVLQETRDPQKLSEVALHRYFFDLKTNQHGVRYVTYSTQDFADGPIRDGSIEVLFRGDLLASSSETRFTQTVREPPLFRDFLNSCILDWFADGEGEEPFSDLSLVVTRILFPALADLGKNDSLKVRIKKDKRISSVLQSLETSMDEDSFEQIRLALRESSDWATFVRSVCPTDVVLTDRDVDALTDNVSLLRVAVMNLGVRISEMKTKGLLHSDFINTFLLNKVDYQCIKFMLDHLPADERVNATRLMFDLASRYVKAKIDGRTSSAFKPGEGWLGKVMLPMEKIPASVRPVMAQEILTTLREGVQSQIDDIENQRVDFWMPVRTGLYDTFIKGYTKHVVTPSLKTSLRVKDIEDRFQELFGLSFPLEENIFIHQSVSGKFWSSNSTKSKDPDFVQRLENPVSKPPVVDYEAADNEHYYINSKGEFCALSRELYSLDSLMSLIESGAKAIDKKLIKLGREVTPANRGAYFTFTHRSRNSRSAWDYIDLGVIEPSKIIALKICKITEEADIRVYSALPDEMFFGLIDLIDSSAAFTAQYYGTNEPYNTATGFYLDTIDGLI